MTYSNRILNSVESIHHSTIQAAFLAMSAAAAVLLVAMFEGRAGAGCPSYFNFYHSSKTEPPCSDTTTCFDAGTQSFNCETGAKIMAYKNINPPNGWYNCTPVSGGGACTETEQACGTTQWFFSSSCNPNFSCTVMPTKSVAFCKAPIPPSP
jgi:hypothetical protein